MWYFLKDIEGWFGISKTSTLRIMDMFCKAISSSTALNISLPKTTTQFDSLCEQFVNCYTINSCFLGCVGCIDGWLAAINKPKQTNGIAPADIYSNHYSAFGLKVQAMCDAQLHFQYFCVTAPGGTIDA